MEQKNALAVEVPPELIDAIHALPARREVQHCGESFAVSPFDIYAVCPRCGTRLKVRALSAVAEVEDVFDAVFEWMSSPAGREAAERRLQEIAADSDE
jgi:hypothetical protein